MAGRLDGKVAVVTGGASGIGLATVEPFAAEGARVVFCDLPPISKEELEDRFGPEKARMHHSGRAKGGPHDGWAIADRLGDHTRFVPCDVTDGDQLTEVIDTALGAFGGLDVMYNNAGIGGAEGTIIECPEAIFDRTIEVDLKAVWMGIKLAGSRLIERGGGSIISTSSSAGISGIPGLGAYSAAKAGVIGLTRVAAQELAPHHVRANCICPGGIVTPIIFENPMRDEPIEADLMRQAMSVAHPIPRAGEGDDIAKAALWLASDDSSFVTGQAIVVDGGITSEFDARARGGAISSALSG